ncbi:hypothetical protein ACSVDE_17800 [Pseudalkalibacillus sp. Hm43]|uniref:hypothetical protein n=1 Tax=Pseudalkalibacillus sp. Hm43 TaxID=3450742 RepID=UPI003F443288
MRFLYQLNVWKSTVIVMIVSLPWFLYILTREEGYETAVLWAYTALVYFILAFILYLFLRMIGKLGRTPARRKLVIFTRVYIRFHVAAGLHGLAAILMHISYMLSIGSAVTSTGQLGILAVFSLGALLTTGYLRKQKSSGRRRRYHRYTAYLFLLLVLLHILF